MDKAGILADIRGTRRKPKTAIERTHVLEELEILRVDGIYRRQSVHIIKHGIRNRIVINLVLRRELIVKLGGRHIRVRLVLQNAVDIVVYGYGRIGGYANVSRRCRGYAAGESVHRRAHGIYIPHIAGVRRKGGLPRAQELIRGVTLVSAALSAENRLKEPSFFCHVFTPLNTYSPRNPVHR